MSTHFPVITIQCDWNEALRLPKWEGWISSKHLNQKSVNETITAKTEDNKVRFEPPKSYEYISHSNLNLVLRHVSSGLKVAFVAPTKVHPVHKKGVLSNDAAENALTVSSCENQLIVWDSRTSEILLELKGHGGPAYKCRFFPSGVVVLSAGADGSCRIWSAETGVNPVTLKGHTMAVMDICIVEKGRNVVSVSRDGTAKLWDVGEAACLDNITEGNGVINCCALATSDEEVAVTNEREIGTSNALLLIGCESGVVQCSHVGARRGVWRRELDAPCNACAVLGDSVVVGLSDGKILQLETQTGATVKEWHESANPILSMTAITDHMFAVGRQDGTCTIYSTQKVFENLRVSLTGSDCDGIRDIAFNGKWLFAASRDTNVRKYDFNQVIVHFK